MISVGLEGPVGEPSRGYEGIVEGLGSGRCGGLGRDGLSGMFGPGKWLSTWDPRPGEVDSNLGRAGVAVEARAGPKALSLLSRGRPVWVIALGFRLGVFLRVRESGPSCA